MYKVFLKRLLDICLSGLALIVLSPVLIFVAVLIHFDMGDPVVFKQKRPGKNGKIFSLYKFRTMKDPIELSTGKKLTDQERLKLVKEKGESAVSTDSDRLTTLGKLLRKLSIDELPELLNILLGQMSIVGPRPLATIYLPYYTEEEMHRHDVRPGLTGLAQVNGRNSISWEKRFEYDLEYVSNVTLKNDMSIILKTIMVVLKHDDIAQGEERPKPFNIVRQEKIDKKGNE